MIETFPVSKFIFDEMQAREWTRADLVLRMAWPLEWVYALLDGLVPIDRDVAINLERAFGVSAETWINLDLAHRIAANKARLAAIAAWRARKAEPPFSCSVAG